MGTSIEALVQRKVGDAWTTLNVVQGVWEGRTIGLKGGEIPRDVYFALTVRNYDVFAILGGIRNGFGVAGAVTGLMFEPIAPGRGYPEDFERLVCPCDQCGDVIEDCGEGPSRSDCIGGCFEALYGQSWVLLSELEAYDWGRVHTYLGWLTAEQYDMWDHRTTPKEYKIIPPNSRIRAITTLDGSVSGEFVKDEEGNDMYDPYPFGLYAEDEFNLLQKHGQPPTGEFYIRVMWDQTNAACAKRFYSTALPWLRSLGFSDSVRLVFGFRS